jgi:hypothetical protein
MKFRITIYLLMLSALSVYGQVGQHDLLGMWICENNDSLYYRSKYITLYNDSIFQEQSAHCNFVEWTIKPDRFLLTNLSKCVNSEEIRMQMTLLKHGLTLKKVGTNSSSIEQGRINR